jgi:putative heme-binding domain-containing protein
MWSHLRGTPELEAVLRRGLATRELQPIAVELAAALGDPQYFAPLMALALTADADPAVRGAAVDAVAIAREARYLPDLDRLAVDPASAVQVSAVHAIGLLAPPDVEIRARDILVSPAANEARAEALRILARTTKGVELLLDLDRAGKFPPELRALAATQVNGPVRRPPTPRAGAAGTEPSAAEREAALAEFKAVRERAAKVFPLPVALDNASLPTIRQMEQNFRPNVAAGRQVFDGLCSTCHALGGEKRLGPDLSAIALKLDREALLDAMVMPSASIAFGYESWVLETKQGRVTGLLVENTPERVTLKIDASQEVRLRPSEITSRRPVPISIMPEGLVNAMTPQQIVDLVSFLTTLRGAAAPAAAR